MFSVSIVAGSLKKLRDKGSHMNVMANAKIMGD